jgi:molybdopterin/thiamine biosynthesis adenylyltransferase
LATNWSFSLPDRRGKRAGTVPSCQQAGILGALAGVLGLMTALESFARSSDSAKGWSDAC